MEELKNNYKIRKKEIRSRLDEFKKLGKSNDKKIFAELCFCICTPQSKAKVCDAAIRKLVNSGVLYAGNKEKIRKYLHGVRFPNNKSSYIVEARKIFSHNQKLKIKKWIDKENIPATRDWLVKNVKGIGYKEASHFLRNIGYGKNLAILDVHILKNLKKFNVIPEIPKSFSKKKYFEIEERMRKFSEEIGIPMDELDLLLWSMETGEVFK